jgi:hypothetical protein
MVVLGLSMVLGEAGLIDIEVYCGTSFLSAFNVVIYHILELAASSYNVRNVSVTIRKG